MTLKVVTANRLGDGDVVYLTAEGAWSPWLEEARASADPARQATLLTIAERAVTARLVVEPYLMPVAEEAGARRALSQREKIRARGPTVRRDLGKQAEPGPQEEFRHDV